MSFSIFLLFLFFNHISASIFEGVHPSKRKCQPIDIPICSDMPYNYTYYASPPDSPSLHSQTEHYRPLFKTKCHPHIQFFICSVYTPMCPPDMPQAVTSCRQVCEEVKRDCIHIFQEFGVPWPEVLDCKNFPTEPDLCMKHPQMVSNQGNSRGSRVPWAVEATCPSDMLDLDPANPQGSCAIKCGQDIMFSHINKEKARSWILIWGTVTLVLTTFAFLTFLVDRKRFRYPQRCFFYMAFCYILFSIPHLFPFFFTYSQMACDRLANGQAYLAFSGFENTICLVSFVLTYYFGTAIFLWWLVFAFTWYLLAGRKWVTEGVDAYSSFLHCFSWGISAVLTIAVLVMHKVDASELTAICGVGNSDPVASLYFSLLPRTVALLVGALFVVFGFASMCRERDSFKGRGTDTSKLERFMLKMGLFCAMFLISSVIWLVCDAYHYLQILRWQPATIGCKTSMSGQCRRPLAPSPDLYILGLMAALISGLSPVLWTLSHKSLISWRQTLCCGLCGTAPQKTVSATASQAARPLLEPPSGPPPQPPQNHYVPMSTHSAWRPSKVV